MQIEVSNDFYPNLQTVLYYLENIYYKTKSKGEIMKKILLLITVALSFGACSWFDKEKKSSPQPQIEASILEFKGLHSQDSGTNIKQKVVSMGKRNMTVYYNKKFSYFDNTSKDSDSYLFNKLKSLFPTSNDNCKFLATSEDNYVTRIMVVEENGAELTKKAMSDENLLKELKGNIYKRVSPLGFGLDYTYRTVIQGNHAVLFKITSRTNHYSGYAALILEDTEKQAFVWALTNDTNKMVDLEKTISGMSFN